MATIGSLVVDIRTNTAKFVQGMSKAQKSVDRMERRVRTFSRIMNGLTALFAGILFAGFINSQIQAGDQIQKMGVRLGESAEALSQYQHVAERSGVAFNTLTMGWQRMTRRVAEAARGTGEAKDALIELGLSAERLNQLAPSEQFEAIARAMEGVANQSDKVRLAMKLFDSEGVSLLQTMEQGAAGLQAMREEADRLGKTLSQDQADQMAIAADASTRLKSSISGLSTTLVANFAPAITDAINLVSDLVPDLADFLDKIGLLDRDIAKLGESSVLRQIADTISDINKETAATKTQGIASGLFGNDPEKSNDNLVQLNEQLQQLYDRLEQINQAKKNGGGDDPIDPSAGVQSGVFSQKYLDDLQKRYDALDQSLMTEAERMRVHYDDMRFTAEESYQAGITSYAEYQASITRIAEQEAQRQIAIEQQKTDMIRNMQQNVWQAAAGFLRTFAGESQAAAIAVIAIEKGLAIAQASMNTAVAYTKALALGGPAYAAQVAALGKIQIGLIAATGLAQAAQVGSGGASPGTAPNPIYTEPASSNLPETLGTQQQGQQSITNITVYGAIPEEMREDMISMIQDAQENDELVLSNS